MIGLHSLSSFDSRHRSAFDDFCDTCRLTLVLLLMRCRCCCIRINVLAHHEDHDLLLNVETLRLLALYVALAIKKLFCTAVGRGLLGSTGNTFSNIASTTIISITAG